MRPSPSSIRSSIASSSSRLHYLRTGNASSCSSSGTPHVRHTRSHAFSTQPWPTATTASSTLIQSQKRPLPHSIPASSPLTQQPVAFYRVANQPPREWHPPADTAGIHDYFVELLPNLAFPDKLAQRMVTHASWKGGIEGNNGRLAFLGRRALHAYMLLFLHSAAARGSIPPADADLSKSLNYEKVAERALDSHALGQHVGRVWQVEQVLRWVSAAPGGEGKSSVKQGSETVSGTTVEAIVGGVLHQYGGNAAHRVFHTRILPFLKPVLPKPVHGYVDEVCMEMGGPNAVISEGQYVVGAQQVSNNPSFAQQQGSNATRRVASQSHA